MNTQPCGLMARLPPDLRDSVHSIMHETRFKAGDQVFGQWAAPGDIFLVVTGRVKVARTTRDGREIVLCVPGPGEIFCPLPVLDEGPHLGSAHALTDTVLLRARGERFRALCKKEPLLLAAVQGACLGEIRRLAEQMEILAISTLRQRLAAVLLQQASQRQASCAPPDDLHFTQQQLASLSGASRESTSRLLALWQRKGIVSLKRGRVTLLRREDLEELAGNARAD